MARRLGAELNTLKLIDNLSGSELEIYYRMPTAQEHIQYTNSLSQRRGNKVVSRVAETRQKFGARILKGFREGDFERPDGKGGWLPLASDPQSKHYAEDWKKQVQDLAPDVIESLAIRVFEASTQAAPDEDLEEEQQGEDAPGNSPETSTP